MHRKLKIVYLVFVVLAIVVCYMRLGADDHRHISGGRMSPFAAICYVFGVLYGFMLEYAHLDIVLVTVPLFLMCIHRITDRGEVPVIYLLGFFIFSASVIYNSVHYYHKFTDNYTLAPGTSDSIAHKYPATIGLNVVPRERSLRNYSRFIIQLPVLYYTAEPAETDKLAGFDRVKDNYSPATELKAVIVFSLYVFSLFMLVYCVYNRANMRISFRI